MMATENQIRDEIKNIGTRGGEYKIGNQTGYWWETGNAEDYHSDEIDPSVDDVLAYYEASRKPADDWDNPSQIALDAWRDTAQSQFDADAGSTGDDQ